MANTFKKKVSGVYYGDGNQTFADYSTNSVSRPSFDRPQSMSLSKSKYRQTTYNENFPGLNESSYKKLENAVDKLGYTGAEKQTAMNQWYRNNVKYLLNDQILEERGNEINEQAYKAAELKSPEADAQLRMTEFSQALKKKYNLDATANDLDVFNTFVTSLGEEGIDLAGQYLAGENKNLRYDAGLETFGEKVEDVGVGILQSPGKRGYNMVGQRVDKLTKPVGERMVGLLNDEQKQEAANYISGLVGEETFNDFGKQTRDQIEKGTIFNGREQTNIRKPILGEERADNKYTKAGEVVGDIGTAIALTAPAGATLAPIMADSSVGGAALLGGMEGALDTALTHYGSQGNLDVTPGEMALGTALGGVGGVVTNKLSNASREAIKNASDKVDDAARATKTATKIADKTDDANRIAGRIGQGDIDDQAKVVEGVKSITKRSGKEGVKAIKKYDQLEDVIKKTERQIVKEEDDLLKQFPEKIKDWKTTETVKGLGDQAEDVTRDYIDDGIKLLKKYNKNDPAALKELEMMQKVKDTEGLTRLEAKDLARKLTTKLSKKFYNSNDELRNSMSAESYEKIRKGIQNAVRDRLPDDVLKNLDIEYSNLKTFEGLADDMAEKVNTLTQKIKETGPIEKLGRKVGDVINRVTGKGIKGLVEKFLPSNMGNKINNSIDMEAELVKNLGKLVDLNNAIDVLNNSLNNPASKSMVTKALNAFANTVDDIQKSITPTMVSTAVRGAEATSNKAYNDLLDK